jgi:uncharacterized membrane protein
MPFREKSAWISLATMLLVFGGFFGGVASGRLAASGMATVHLLILAVLAVIGLQVVLKLAARGLARGDADAPKDERERLIELKATRIAFHVLVGAVLLAVFLVIHTRVAGGPFPGSPRLGLAMVACIVLADVVRSAAQIVYFRRGA